MYTEINEKDQVHRVGGGTKVEGKGADWNIKPDVADELGGSPIGSSSIDSLDLR